MASFIWHNVRGRRVHRLWALLGRLLPGWRIADDTMLSANRTTVDTYRHNRGAMGIFTRTGGTIGLFGMWRGAARAAWNNTYGRDII